MYISTYVCVHMHESMVKPLHFIDIRNTISWSRPSEISNIKPNFIKSMQSHDQWRNYTGAHWGTGPTIGFCGPTINIWFYHMHGVHCYTYTYTLFILIYKLQIPSC